MIIRTIQSQVQQAIGKWKIIIVYGPRQVGKTTLVKGIIQDQDHTWYVTGDDPQSRQMFTNPSLQTLREMLSWYKLLVIDEAQRIQNIGVTLKLIVDNIPDVQVIATGSSSFELANTINEPLTGRTIIFHLYPFSREELRSSYDPIQRISLLESRMIYGMYPEVVLWSDQNHLKRIVDSYLYKDILEHQRVKKSDILMKLLQALALQLWSEVSYHELSQIVWVDTATVERYISLLEQSFVIVRLWCLSRNIRNELKKSKKIYFRDIGVRNTIINAMNPLALRNDVGALWENFCVIERLKRNSYHRIYKNTYFWRTLTQQEIDFVEESNMMFDAYEFKRSDKKKSKVPTNFAQAYQHTFSTITRENFESFVCNI